MSHWRHGRSVSGAQPRSGLHIGADTHADNVIQLASRLPPGTARLNSRSKEVEPFIDPFEFGSNILFAAVVLAPIAIVGGIVIGYLAFVA